MRPRGVLFVSLSALLFACGSTRKDAARTVTEAGGTGAADDSSAGTTFQAGSDAGGAGTGGAAGSAGSSAVGGQTDAGGTSAGESGAGEGEGVACDGGRSITTEAEYASLVAESCREIAGGLHIVGIDFPLTPALDKLVAIGDDLRVHANPNLVNFDFVPALETVGGTLAVYQNESLESFVGLENLKHIADGLQINTTNPSLKSLQGLDSLEIVVGLVTLTSPLETLVGLQLKSVEGRIVIAGTALTSLVGLEDLTSVIALTVASNAALTSLDGLENLTSTDALEISLNPLLSSLSPLTDWPADVVSSTLSIKDNAILPPCEVDALDAAQTSADCFDCINNQGTCE